MKTQRTIEAWLKRMKTAMFPSADDKAWRKWIDAKERVFHDLRGLLNEPVRDSIKVRALFLLLVPNARWVPFYWREHQRFRIGTFQHPNDFWESLTPHLRELGATFIIEFCDYLRPLHNPTPTTNILGGGPRLIIFESVPDRYHDALYYYNRCIHHLMSLLPEELATELFRRFSLIDVSTYATIDENSGYEPFCNLLFDETIGESWKRKADARMRQIILAERQGLRQPREDWEDALSSYSETLANVAHCKKLPYSKELLANQFEFLISDELQGGRRWIMGHNLLPIFAFLDGDEYRDLRYRIARFACFGSSRSFSVYDADSEALAFTLIDAFGETDSQLADHLRTLVDAYDLKLTERRKQNETLAARVAEDQAKEKRLLEAMR